ncbi:sialate O-acetylesterase [Sphingomonas sp. 37zxx]|uniref:sialate O-acetylesterase n=1 Tax=Sphingomonas sp. 37zxx TaxID=1550073 RepID=UPI00068D07E0|nr:sialate O-acetylesterase [Sphingomonas sp. 37zxx]
MALTVACGLPRAEAQPVSTKFNSLFQNHMVMQRNKPIRIWGRGAPKSRLTVTFAGQSRSIAVDKMGRWNVEFPARAAATGLSLALREASGIETRLDDVAIGDVFLCSGQSNMEFSTGYALNSKQELAKPGDRAIRLLEIRQAAVSSRAEDIPTESVWSVPNAANVKDFSALCMFFGRQVTADRKVSVGLVQSAWGGTQIESWMSGAAIRAADASVPGLALLDLHARDSVAGQAAYGKIWERWWEQRRPGADVPWMVTSEQVAEMPSVTTPGNWRKSADPALATFDGTNWFHRPTTLTPAQAKAVTRAMLGAVAPIGALWINGYFVGGTRGDGVAVLDVPKGVLRAGINIVSVAAVGANRNAPAGLIGPAAAMQLAGIDGTSVSIADGWHYQRGENRAEWPPAAPWEDRRGLTGIYNAMIAPLGTFSFAGVLWYQGENNASGGTTPYAPLLSSMMESWRGQFQDRELPFIIFQLANFGSLTPVPQNDRWSAVREAQRRVVADDRNAALVVLIDIGERFDIHPPNKQVAAARAYRAAKHVIYREPGIPSGPSPRGAYRDGHTVVVRFGDIADQLVVMSGNRPNAFELCAGNGQNCYFADAIIEGANVRIEGSSGKPAEIVRYCWAAAPMCTLYDKSGEPVGPFELTVAPAIIGRHQERSLYQPTVSDPSAEPMRRQATATWIDLEQGTRIRL